MAFVFVENFGIKLDLKSVDSQNFLQVRNRIPETQIVAIFYPPIALLRLSLFPPPKNPLLPVFVAFAPAPLLALLKLF